MNNGLTEDTKTIILLCGEFGKNCAEKPLSLKEYSLLVKWLIKLKKRPADLLLKENIPEASKESRIPKQRLESLLSRGIQLGFAVEEWQRNGIWIISRSDTEYPDRYKKHLREQAPPLLFGVGNKSLLNGGGIGIVGSRNVDKEGEVFTRQVAELCVANNMPVVSGGARGVDQISMTTALEAGGVVIGVLAENLLKKSVERKYRQAIANGQLLLLSPYHPKARFTVYCAMARNKLIYAMADYGLVVSSDYKKGGTWSGAEEELKRANALPVFVRTGDNMPKGNNKLLELGTIPWPDSIPHDNLKQQLDDLVIRDRELKEAQNPNLFKFEPPPELAQSEVSEQQINAKENPTNLDTNSESSELQPKSIYDAVLPVILSKLDTPQALTELTELLNVNKNQLTEWLNKAITESKIIKLQNPVRYKKVDTVIQDTLL